MLGPVQRLMKNNSKLTNLVGGLYKTLLGEDGLCIVALPGAAAPVRSSGAGAEPPPSTHNG